MEIFCILAGVLFAYTHHSILLLFLLSSVYITQKGQFIFYFIAASLFALLHQNIYQGDSPNLEVISKAHVKGYIISIPEVKNNKTQLQFLVQEIDNQPANFVVLLSWFNQTPEMYAGQYWEFWAKLKRPRNLNNPGGFDYVQWLAAKHILWQGYIKTGKHPPHKAKNSLALKMLLLRERLGHLLQQRAPDPTTSAVAKALTLGLTHSLNSEQWNLFRRTGTTHLMVISGAHIGLIMAMVYKLVRRLWCYCPRLVIRWPAPKIAAIVGVFSALLYALIAGFAAPAQRSFWGCAFASMQLYGKRYYSGWQAWRYGLYFVVFLEPHCVLLPGFYLSFMAVAWIILVHQRWPFSGFKKILFMQSACLLGLLPFTLWWFSYGSLTGFIANIFAIPLVGFLIVPLSLMSLLLIPWECSSVLLKLLAYLITILMQGLHYVDNISAINLTLSMNNILTPLALLTSLFLFVIYPIGPMRLAAIVLFLSCMFPQYPKISSNTACIRILDVGQGLAVLVQTKSHTLLYDTGDKFYQGGDMGQLVILPLLKHLGITKLDKVIISHQDKDHYGGFESIKNHIKIDDIIVNDPVFFKLGRSCHKASAWEWEGVHFRFFPIKKVFHEKNNTSCILQISTSKTRLLLTGDIEKNAENYLVDTYGEALQSEILLVPHHGSKTSSSLRFIHTINPHYAIASLGFDNKFHFPHKDILQRYKLAQIPFYTTEQSGMFHIILDRSIPKLRFHVPKTIT